MSVWEETQTTFFFSGVKKHVIPPPDFFIFKGGGLEFCQSDIQVLNQSCKPDRHWFFSKRRSTIPETRGREKTYHLPANCLFSLFLALFHKKRLWIFPLHSCLGGCSFILWTSLDLPPECVGKRATGTTLLEDSWAEAMLLTFHQ